MVFEIGLIKKYFIPDLYCENIYCITAKQLASLGIKGVVLDIDNTLEPYEVEKPTPAVLEWLDAIRSEGISCAFVSNNEAERVELFNSELGFFASAKSGKPKTGKIFEAMKFMETDKNSTALIGDQILTDVLAGKRAGLRTYLVKPIKDKASLFFKFKRSIEKPLLRIYEREAEKKNK